MSIGLYDADMRTYGQVPFNLELMKLAAYYKKKKEITIFSTELNPQRYTKFFYRKDYFDGTYPTEIANEKNVVLDGYAFHPEIYFPMKMEIELTPPDKTIYLKYEDFFVDKKTRKKIFNSMYNATHLRLSVDGEQVMDKFERQIIDSKISALFFHDLHLDKVKDSFEVIKELKKNENPKQPIRIGSKYPIQTYSDEELINWLSFDTMINYYQIYHFGFLNDGTLVNNLGGARSKNIITQFIYIPFAGEITYDNFMKEKGHRLFLQLNYMRGIKRPIKLSNGFFEDERWNKVIDFINGYLTSVMGFEKGGAPYKSFTPIAYARLLKKYQGKKTRFLKEQLTIEELRQIFYFVQKENYELFKLFYECGYSRYEGGELIPCME